MRRTITTRLGPLETHATADLAHPNRFAALAVVNAYRSRSGHGSYRDFRGY